jgi:hypothetical protein
MQTVNHYLRVALWRVTVLGPRVRGMSSPQPLITHQRFEQREPQRVEFVATYVGMTLSHWYDEDADTTHEEQRKAFFDNLQQLVDALREEGTKR